MPARDSRTDEIELCFQIRICLASRSSYVELCEVEPKRNDCKFVIDDSSSELSIRCMLQSLVDHQLPGFRVDADEEIIEQGVDISTKYQAVVGALENRMARMRDDMCGLQDGFYGCASDDAFLVVAQHRCSAEHCLGGPRFLEPQFAFFCRSEDRVVKVAHSVLPFIARAGGCGWRG